MAEGQLKKMEIYAYDNVKMETLVKGIANPYIALINPETYTVDIKSEFKNQQGQGTTGGTQGFIVKRPEEMTFEFLFDNTGIIDNKPLTDIAKDIENFQKFLMEYDGNVHEPRFYKFVWGTALFKGRCSALSIIYKLFNSDGSPIRATCKVTLKQATDEELRVLMQKDKSPDLTHYRIIKKGDTLPLLCYQVYGDPKYYLQVAAVNKLSNFRVLQPGEEVFFPPVKNEISA